MMQALSEFVRTQLGGVAASRGRGDSPAPRDRDDRPRPQRGAAVRRDKAANGDEDRDEDAWIRRVLLDLKLSRSLLSCMARRRRAVNDPKVRKAGLWQHYNVSRDGDHEACQAAEALAALLALLGEARQAGAVTAACGRDEIVAAFYLLEAFHDSECEDLRANIRDYYKYRTKEQRDCKIALVEEISYEILGACAGALVPSNRRESAMLARISRTCPELFDEVVGTVRDAYTFEQRTTRSQAAA